MAISRINILCCPLKMENTIFFQWEKYAFLAGARNFKFRTKSGLQPFVEVLSTYLRSLKLMGMNTCF